MAGYNFKDEKEVQEYLKNLYIEYQFGCLSEKKPEGKVSLLTILTSSLQCFTFSDSVSSSGRLLRIYQEKFEGGNKTVQEELRRAQLWEKLREIRRLQNNGSVKMARASHQPGKLKYEYWAILLYATLTNIR